MCCELRLPTAVQEVLGQKKQTVITKVNEFNEKHAAQFSSPAQPGASGAIVPVTPRRGSSRGGETPRTQSRPVFRAPEAPMSVSRTLDPAEKLALSDFQAQYQPLGVHLSSALDACAPLICANSSVRCAGQAPTTSNSKVTLAVTTAPSRGLWLINEATEGIQMQSGEMAGFNTGNFAEKLLQTARTKQDALPFILDCDYHHMVLVEDAGKRLTTLAELVCELAGQGTTELNLTDHDLAQVVEARMSCCSLLAS